MATTGESKLIILALSVTVAFFVAVSVMIHGKTHSNNSVNEDKKE
jgi:hypothetical protein